jgi:hypothetical protein
MVHGRQVKVFVAEDLTHRIAPSERVENGSLGMAFYVAIPFRVLMHAQQMDRAW